MTQVNMFDAKTNLSKLVALLESGKEDVITIARNGSPVVQMTLCREISKKQRIGVLKGEYSWPEEFDSWDDEVAELFEVKA